MAGSKMRLNTLVYKGWTHEHEAMLARNDGFCVFFTASACKGYSRGAAFGHNNPLLNPKPSTQQPFPKPSN